jgi:signal peptide peptidase SppA
LRHAYRTLAALTYNAVELEPGAKILRPSKLMANGSGRLATIEMAGLLTPEYLFDLRQRFIALERDESVTSILFLVDSPGGFVMGTPELASIVRRVNAAKPIVAVCENYVASAAYWIASQASKIVISPSCNCGSIGAFDIIIDDSEFHDRMGVKVIRVRTGPLKGIGVPGIKPSDEEIAEVQRDVDSILRDFQMDVLRAKRLTPAQLVKLSTGQAWRGREAVSLGLADRVAILEDLIAESEQESQRHAADTKRQVVTKIEKLTGEAAVDKFYELAAQLNGGSAFGCEKHHATIASKYPRLAAAALRADPAIAEEVEALAR